MKRVLPGSLVSLFLLVSWPLAGANPQSITWGGYQPGIPTLFLESKAAIVPDKSKKTDCTIRIAFPSALSVTNALKGVVRIHGSSSQAYQKKSYAIALEDPLSVPGLRPRTHWVLNAAYIDRSLMRHKLSYDLFQAMSRPAAPRPASGSRFTELYLNGQYTGVYLLIERVDKALLGLTPFRSNDVSHACIYKANDHSPNWDHGGHPGFEQREPDAPVSYWKPLDTLSDFVARSRDAEFFHPQTGLASRLDVDSAMDFHLLVLLTSNMDGIDKNFMLARDAEKPGQAPPLFFFIPWDYDATFGRNWEGSRVSPDAWLASRLFDRLLSNADYRKRFAARWNELRSGPFSVEKIHAMIDENARTVRDAMVRNNTRWASAGGYPDRLTFDQDITQMKEWVVKRTAWLDAQIAQRNR